MDYSDLPINARSVSDKQESWKRLNPEEIRQHDCDMCGDTLYEIEANNNIRWTDKDGNFRGDAIGGSLVHIEDTSDSAYPRDVTGEKQNACGWCVNVDHFESKGSEIFGILPNGKTTGIFKIGTVIDDHYLGEEYYTDTIFRDAFEQLITNSTTPDGYVSIDISRQTKRKMKLGKYTPPVPVIITEMRAFVKSEDKDELENSL